MGQRKARPFPPTSALTSPPSFPPYHSHPHTHHTMSYIPPAPRDAAPTSGPARVPLSQYLWPLMPWRVASIQLPALDFST